MLRSQARQIRKFFLGLLEAGRLRRRVRIVRRPTFAVTRSNAAGASRTSGGHGFVREAFKAGGSQQ